MNFIQQAYKGKNEGWRYLLTSLFIFIGWQIIGILPIATVAIMYSSDMSEFRKAANDNFMSLGINSNLYLFVMILMFAIGLTFLVYGVKWFHRRKALSLFTSRKYFDWKRTFYTFFLWFIISSVLILIDYFTNTENYVWNLKIVPFIILVFISFVFLPLQTTFEEVLFRGYLMQGIGVGFKNRWAPLLITSVIFGLLHSFNPEVEKLGQIIMLYYIGTGLFFGIITLMDEGLELTIGLHAANNIAAAIFVTTNWTVFQTDALLIDISEPDLTLQMYIPILVIYPILLFILSKKYHWKDWSEKLLGKIKKPI